MKKIAIVLLVLSFFMINGCTNDKSSLEKQQIQVNNVTIDNLEVEVEESDTKEESLDGKGEEENKVEQVDKATSEKQEESMDGTEDLNNIRAEELVELVDVNGIIKSDIAKSLVEKRAKEVINALSTSDMEKLANYVYPSLGIRFSPYTYVNTDRDRVVKREDMSHFIEDPNNYTFGTYDGIGDDIIYTWKEYYEEFVYSVDFENAEKVSYNESISFGNMINNVHEIYKDAIVVEYYFSGFLPEFGGADWKSLRIVYQEYEGDWYVVGIIHNQWTV